MACFLWSETQKTGAIVAGIIFIILGTMLYFVGMSQSSGKDKAIYTCKFWKINVWLVSFVPVSVFYNALFGVVAPYPIPFANFILVFVAFWLAYIGVMIYPILFRIMIIIIFPLWLYIIPNPFPQRTIS